MLLSLFPLSRLQESFSDTKSSTEARASSTFSNSVPPAVVCASLKALELAADSGELRKRLMDNTLYFRNAMKQAGFTIKEGTHPIVPVMLGDALLAQKMAASLLAKGVYVTGFYYPVVPKGEARIRTQISAAHSRKDLEFAVQAFIEAKKEAGI